MPKLYLGLRTTTAQTLQWSSDNVTYTDLVIPAGTVWYSPYHAVAALRTLLSATGMTHWNLLVMTGSNDAVTVKAVPAGPSGFGLKFAAATEIDAYLGSPGNIWQPAASALAYIGQINPVYLQHILQAGWRERSVQRYAGGVAVRGDGSGETLTQAVGLEVLAGMRLRIAIANLAAYRTAMTTAMQGAPIGLWYENLLLDGTPPLSFMDQQHIAGWLAASETAITMTAEFDLTDYWASQFQLRVMEVADA